MIDTGFNGDLVIYESLTEKLQAESIGKTQIITAGNQKLIASLSKLKLKIIGEDSVCFTAIALVLPDSQKEMIIGWKFLSLINLELGTSTVLNFQNSSVDFIQQ